MKLSRSHIIELIKSAGFVALPTEEIKPGDLYIAVRNDGLKLLTCKYIESIPNMQPPWIVCEEIEYYYDLDECVKIKAKQRRKIENGITSLETRELQS